MYRYLLRGLSLIWFCLTLLIWGVMYWGQSYDNPVLSFIAVQDNITDIFLYDLRTGLYNNVTDTVYPEWYITWSQNRYLLYTATVTRTEQVADGLFVMRRLGQPRRILTPETSLAYGTDFAPNGQSFIYFSSYPRNYSDIYQIHLSNGQTINLSHTPEQSEITPIWSPNGQELLFLLDENLYRIDIASQEKSLFLNLDKPISEPIWSPDAQHIAFLTTIWQEGRYVYQLHIIATDGTNLRQIYLESEPRADAISWSPDSCCTVLGLTSGELAIVDIVTGNTVYLMGEGRRFAPTWSPDGRWIAFVENRAIHFLDLHTNSVYQLDNQRRVRVPMHWMP